MRVLIALVGLVSTHFAACTALPPPTPVSHSYFADVGDVEGRLLSQAVGEVLLDRRGFTFERRDESYASLYFETGWKERSPFPAEEAEEVVAARSRVILRGRRITGGEYRVTLEGENQIRTDSVPAWHTAPLTVDFRGWMAEIVENLRQLVGLR